MSEIVTADKFRTINCTEAPYRLKKDEVAFAVNVDFLDDQTISQRAGSALVETLGVDVQLFTFNEIRNGVVTEHLLAFGGTQGFRFNGTTFDEIVSGLTDSIRYGGCGYVGTFVFSNGTDIMAFKWDTDTSAYVVSAVADPEAPKALFWVEYQGCLFACGDGTENLMWSDTGQPESWNAVKFIALGAMPKSMCVVGEFLFVGTDRGIFKISVTGDADIPFKMVQLISIGVLGDTMCEIQPGILGAWLMNSKFLTFNQYAQSGVELVSKYGEPVRAAIEACDLNSTGIISFSDKKTGRTLYSMNIDYPMDNYDIIFPVTGDNNIQFVLNNSLGWSFYNLPIRSIAEYDGKIYFSDFNGNVFKFDKSLYQDNGAEFESVVVTGCYDMARPDMQKGFRRMWLSANSNSETSINVSFATDYSMLMEYVFSKDYYAYGGVYDSSKWDEFIWNGTLNQISTIDLDVFGASIQFMFDKNHANADMQIKGFLFDWNPSNQEGY